MFFLLLLLSTTCLYIDTLSQRCFFRAIMAIDCSFLYVRGSTAPPAAGGERSLQRRSPRSVLRSSADWRDVTPEQDAFLQQHTIQTEHRRKKTWTRRGKLEWFVVQARVWAFSVLSKLSLRLNSGASTPGRAAVPGWCFHPEELHSGFCLRHANKLACLISFGCFAKSRAGSADAVLGVYNSNIRRDSKSTTTPGH